MSDDAGAEQEHFEHGAEQEAEGATEADGQQKAKKRRPAGGQVRGIIEKFQQIEAADKRLVSRLAALLSTGLDAIDITAAVYAPRVPQRSHAQSLRELFTMQADNPVLTGMTIMGLEPETRKAVWRVLDAMGWVDGQMPRQELQASLKITEALGHRLRAVGELDALIALADVRA